MSLLGFLLVAIVAVFLLLAIAVQLDIMEAKWEQQNRKLMERWDANRRGQANVVDFQAWRERKQDERGAA